MKKALATRPDVAYTDFLKSLDVIFLSLAECEARIDRRRFFNTDERLAMDAHAEWTRAGKDSFDVRATIVINTIPANKKDGSLMVKAVYLVHLHSKPPINEQHIRRFVQADLRILIWPYFREFIASTTARMHIPPITLPITGGKKR
jgi:preprotein translocase subunit SecB